MDEPIRNSVHLIKFYMWQQFYDTQYMRISSATLLKTFTLGNIVLDLASSFFRDSMVCKTVDSWPKSYS